MRNLSIRKPRQRPRKQRSGLRQLADWLVVAVLFGLCAFLVLRLEKIGSVSLSGAVIVHDGDTVSQGGRRLRLRGIDAFEIDQTCRIGDRDKACGRQARDELRRLVAYSAVSCTGSGNDRYGRLLVVCHDGERDLNRAMVESGWALAYGDYEDAERRARADAKGAWAGTFDRPAKWREAGGAPGEDEHNALAELIAWLRRIFE